ncbi:hypothetical protein [Campylobacter sp. RM12651]|uniref:hypothetical protein n=1 Tax=Campylobacter sp. RM12651 TaxID=1660079 RepID=UPI001EFA8E18|nr:hypothetical protein [Campylobacter sp. RM12651]ULO04563.1 hypothetical protein AVBRAN_a0081 [Campylobacter sp. RM12651]
MTNQINESVKELTEKMEDCAKKIESYYKEIDGKNYLNYEHNKILNELKDLKIKNERDLYNWAYPYWSEIDNKQTNFFTDRVKENFKALIKTKTKIINLENIQKELNKKTELNENDYKVGDILVNVWGYDQTNIDFYQVISTTKKSIKITEIGTRLDKEHSNSYEDALKPNKGSFLGKEIIITRSKTPKLKGYYFLHKTKEDELFYETNSYCKR